MSTIKGLLLTGDGVNGTGTANNVMKWQDSDTATDSIITDNGSTVTISGDLSATNISGTLSTAAQTNITSVGTLSSLAVSGDVTVENLNPLIRLSSTSGPYSDILSNTVGTLQFMADEGNTGANTSMRFRVDGAERMRIDASGNVGIGVSGPLTKLQINDETAKSTKSTLHLRGGVFNAAEEGASITFTNTGLATTSAMARIHSALNFYNGSIELGSLVFDTSGSERMRINQIGNVGIGTSSPTFKLEAVQGVVGVFDAIKISNPSASGNGRGSQLQFANASGTAFIRLFYEGSASQELQMSAPNKIRFFQDTEVGASYSSKNLVIYGSLSKGSGSFKIDHPLKPETHHLVHSFVESPQANNIYRGKVQLIDGKATVNLDEVSTMTEGTFAALNRDIHTYTSNESDWDAVRGKVEGNILTIECQNTSSNAAVSWLVIGERQDKHMYDTGWTDENGKVIVEPLKQENND